MKKRQKIWIVVLLTLLAAAAVFFALFGSGGKDDAPRTGNLIVNGDFALTTDGEPDGWQTGAWVTSAGASYLEAVTLEDVYEPYLMQLGFLTRTPRGRCVTALAYDHLHIPYEGQSQFSI